MITEDYVSFETAKLLKEKGFNEPTIMIYNDKGVIDNVGSIHHYNSEPTFKCSGCISAPTQQMAMKWLREVHNIAISPYALSLGWYFEIFDLTKKDVTGCKPLYKVGIPSKITVLSSYEEAVGAAIKYCLENLI